MKRYLGLESKSALGDVVGIGHLALIGTDSFGLGFGICSLTASAFWRIPLGAMTSDHFNRAAKLMLTGQGFGNEFLLLGQAAPPFPLPFLPSSPFPFPSPSFPVL